MWLMLFHKFSSGLPEITWPLVAARIGLNEHCALVLHVLVPAPFTVTQAPLEHTLWVTVAHCAFVVHVLVPAPLAVMQTPPEHVLWVRLSSATLIRGLAADASFRFALNPEGRPAAL